LLHSIPFSPSSSLIPNPACFRVDQKFRIVCASAPLSAACLRHPASV
jgi:hypothetical protein